MPIVEGNIRKMHASAVDGLASYSLPIGEHNLAIDPLIGQTLSVRWNGDIHCVHCNRKTRKSFNQGYCYPCVMKLAQCDTCIIKPEQCHYDQGTCREPEWGEAHCLTDHFVYLANTGTVKVGITRHVSDGISSRWLDQGATQAIPLLRVKDRLTSGLVETACKQHIADKTNWRTMLKGTPDDVDLAARKQELLALIADDIATIQQQQGLQSVAEVDGPAVAIRYPVSHYPEKIKSINLDKDGEFAGQLQGIKGQYWLLDGDRVINLRKYAGYHLHIEYQGA
ncbi:DUF2797 domain-containing protein [Aestuariibacter halophilus]|uniref:DUF2797 domain-containing protein n=1 Tax=Fluctibacter halophilus TaxID=226011 RepID=A0ABS8GBG3_9ALTE|nr:DUF2797 domain-containing protein [Aestuariibacter halophilus]MCC2616561.1 DUF2797 domain-containing protein [Aestuariibacter halophilus]